MIELYLIITHLLRNRHWGEVMMHFSTSCAKIMRQIPFANYFLFFVCKLGIKNPAESFDSQLSNAYEISYPVPA